MKDKSPRPLAGIRVLDLTQALSGPFATMILSDLGADIVKIEPPRGDLTRSTPPHFIDSTSIYFIANNRGKRSVVLDLKRAAEHGIFMELVRTSDVVVSNYSAGVLERLRLQHDALARVNPRIISAVISGYGAKGPHSAERAVDLVIQAVAGGMSITGHEGGEPARAGVPTADLSAGLFATIGILAALEERNRTGLGRLVETSLFHSQLTLLNYVATYAAYTGVSPGRMGSGHLGTVPSQAFATSDGWVVIDAGFDAHFRTLCEILEIPQLALDQRFVDRASRAMNRDTLLGVIQPILRCRRTSELTTKLNIAGVPTAPLNDVNQAMEEARRSGYASVLDVEFRGERVSALATPIWIDGKDLKSGTTAPELGADTRAVLCERLGMASSDLDLLLHEAVPDAPDRASAREAGAAR